MGRLLSQGHQERAPDKDRRLQQVSCLWDTRESLSCEGVLAAGFQRCWRIPVVGGGQDSPGPGPEQCSLVRVHHCWEQRDGVESPEVPSRVNLPVMLRLASGFI